MKININNYESYFLLYIDNELSAEERKMVEDFALQNPALGEELEILTETVLTPQENLDFNKEILYRTEDSIAPATQQLLLHLDGELDAVTSADVQQQLEVNPRLAAEWKDLLKTKLDAAEVIAHPDKAGLLKKEPARVISLGMIKWAVAAAIIAAGAFWIINTSAPENTLIQDPLATTSEVKPADKKIGEAVSTEQSGTNAASTLARVEDTHTNEANVSATRTAAATNNAVSQNLPQANDKPEAAMAKSEIQQATISKPDISIMNLKRANADKPELIAAISAKEKPRQVTEPIDLNLNPVETPYARTASLSEPVNDNQVFLADEADVTESKAGAFFKKIKRTVARTTNIPTGKTLKIGAFEFAVK